MHSLEYHSQTISISEKKKKPRCKSTCMECQHVYVKNNKEEKEQIYVCLHLYKILCKCT